MQTEEQRRWPLQVESVNRMELMIGCVLVPLSFLTSLFFDRRTIQILDSLERALADWERTELLEAAMLLVIMNSLRSIPHYVGAYFIGESIEFRAGERSAWPINAVLIVVLLQLTYWGIEVVHGIRYDFDVTAVLVSAFVVFFRKLNYQYVALAKKALLIVIFLTTFQFLDVMPAVNSLPIARGELSWDVKLAAAQMSAEPMLNAVSAVGMLLFFLFSVLVFFQLREENSLRELNSLRERYQAVQVQSQVNEMKNRTFQEMQYLVHDLKSPLTAMQTLVGVMKMDSEQQQRMREVEYLSRIEEAGEQMNRMISEILYKDRRSPITTQVLLNVVMVQSSVTDYAAYLHVDNQEPEAQVSANRMQFPRVLINLIQNSARAIPEGREPEIWLRVEKCREENEEKIVFSVADNGRGIDQKQQDAIWDRGVSGRDSSGLGLAFVRSVVEGMEGEIRVESVKNEGTKISIVLPMEGKAL